MGPGHYSTVGSLARGRPRPPQERGHAGQHVIAQHILVAERRGGMEAGDDHDGIRG